MVWRVRMGYGCYIVILYHTALANGCHLTKTVYRYMIVLILKKSFESEPFSPYMGLQNVVFGPMGENPIRPRTNRSKSAKC